MFGIGTTEIVVILVVALLVLGPKKLPEIARSLGKTLAEFRRVSTDVKRTIELEVDREEEARAKKRIRQEMAEKASHEAESQSRESTAQESSGPVQPNAEMYSETASSAEAAASKAAGADSSSADQTAEPKTRNSSS
ncbi:MAG: TatA/E family twin arginine-targeting protein translocase [Desulfonatronovibrionaceae bacterium]